MSDVAEPRLGLSGAIAKKFLLSEITPLLALVGLLIVTFAFVGVNMFLGGMHSYGRM